MGYEYTAVIATNNEDYGTDIDWGDLAGFIDEKVVDDKKTTYRIGWAKGADRVVEYFLDSIVLKEADSGAEYYLSESYGIIQMGEESTDVEFWGDYWEYDIEYERHIEIF